MLEPRASSFTLIGDPSGEFALVVGIPLGTLLEAAKDALQPPVQTPLLVLAPQCNLRFIFLIFDQPRNLSLFNSDAFREVSRLIYIAPFLYCCVVSDQLQWYEHQDRVKYRMAPRYLDVVVKWGFDLFVMANDYDRSVARFDFRNRR